jgi:AcrR family transcriptional regulator
MTREVPAYHQRVADQNRTAIVAAATALFLDRGYDRTSLARVAETAGVSKATLFKQFPTKAALFEAMVLAVGEPPDTSVAVPPTGDLRAGLLALGGEYAALLTRPRTAELIRLVIADAHRFPELRERTFDFGTVPALTALNEYFRAERDAGGVTTDAPDIAPPQFLGMIANAVFWPQLIHPTWSIVDEETGVAVEEATRTIIARYGTRSVASSCPSPT